MVILKARKNQRLYLTKRQEKILIGCVLGDGYIGPRGKIQIEHSKKQKNYIDWKYSELKSISYGLPKAVSRPDKRYNKVYVSYRFWTRQFFRPWRERFYPNGKKIFPEIYLKDLSPLTLAIWYMDDGYLHEGKRIVLSTDSFDWRDIERIQKALKYCFNLKTNVKSSRKIILGTKETRKFIDIVKPFVIPSMKYKVF